MGHCDTCKHWRPFKEPKRSQYWQPPLYESVEVANRLGLCGRVGMLNDYYHHDEDGLRNGSHDGVLAAVEDLSNNAFLRTGAKFGCVLWEPK